MALQRKQLSVENARTRLEDLCARSEHCESELRDKLRRWGIRESDADDILAGMRKGRFYDDRRFASAYVRDKLRYSRWGRRRIQLGLLSKRVARDVVDEALDEIDAEEYDGILLSLARAKVRTVKEGNSFEGKSKVYRFLIARGFEPGMVSRVINCGELWNE